MLPELRTERLHLRPLADADFETFYDTLVADARVMRFYHSYRHLTDDDARRAKARRDFFDHFREGALSHGYIAWGLFRGGQFIGWCGITTPALSDANLGPEVQFMLATSAQGQGYATEAVAAVVADALGRHDLRTVHAVADAPNEASRRVLERAGFSLRGPVEVYGSKEMVLYTLI